MPLRDLRAIYEVLFRDGVMVAKKDKRPQTMHPEIQDVSNLQVIRAMVSLKSRGFVKETFAWRHFYWYLTNEGIVYLRDYLRLPAEIVPASLQRVRKPAATLAIAHRAAQVQSVEGPTSYVPKPGRRGEAESQEAMAERQSYRHRMMGSGEKESYSDRTPRFRGRPQAAEPVRPKASWDMEDQAQPLFRKGSSFRSETTMMEESRVKRVSRQQVDVSSERVVTTSQERRVSEVQNEKVQSSVSSIITPPLTVAAVAAATGAAISKMPVEPSTHKTNKEKPKIVIEKASMKPAEISTPPGKVIKEDKMKKVIVDQIKSAEVKPQAVVTMASTQETTKLLTDTATITKAVNKVVMEEKLKIAKVNEESIKTAEVKTPVESEMNHEKAKTTAKVTITQETPKPKPDSTAGKPVESTNATEEISKVKVTQEPIDAKVTSKSKEVPQKTTTVTETSILEVKTTISKTTLSKAMASSEDAKPVTAPRVKDEKEAPEETQKVLVEVPTLVQKEVSSPEKNVASTEVVVETKQVVEGSSKSKRKKKKGDKSKSNNAEVPPDTKVEEEKISKDKISKEVVEDSLQPTPVITSELLTVSTSIKTEGLSSAEKNKSDAKLNITREQTKDVPKQTETSLPLNQTSAVPPVDLPENAQVKEKAEESRVSKTTLGPLCPKPELNANLPLVEQVKSVETTVTKVETVTVQKTTKVELIQESSKPEVKSPVPQSESQKPTVESKSLISTDKAAEESSKGKKKGKGKKQAQAPASEAINIKPVVLPEAEASTDITSLPSAKVKHSPVMASELGKVNVSPKMTSERMCSEETRQAAAVLSEAPSDKGEVEPAPLCAEKIKREVPKPKTSFTAREAPAAGELASAAPAVTAEAAVAQTQASPLVEQEEPLRVAQHSATQAAERSTEKSLSVSEALKQEGEKKRDLEEDTPSATATPAVNQPHPEDTCESENPELDETMKRKIVVVEEIVEVKQIISPQATGEQSPPPPVQSEQEGEELDLDVLEALAIEKALLSGAAGATVQGASPEPEWDHSLEDPEEKTWPNFIEGLFESVPIHLLPILFSLSLSLHVM